jgi:hypothetical protein
MAMPRQVIVDDVSRSLRQPRVVLEGFSAARYHTYYPKGLVKLPNQFLQAFSGHTPYLSLPEQIRQLKQL